MHRPPKVQFYTKFIKPEGAHDTAFLEILKDYYLNNSLRVEIRKGHGKDQSAIVQEAINRIGDYDRRIVVMDQDKSQAEMAKADDLASKNHIAVIRNYPCIEGVLIKILEPNKSINGMSPHELKAYFEKNYIPRTKRTNKDIYKSKFPKALLDEARKRVPELNNLIELFEEK